MNKEEYQKLIEKYLQENLDKEEQKILDEKVMHDTEISKLLHHQKRLQQALKNKDRIGYLAKIKKAEAGYFKKKTFFPFLANNKAVYYSAAAIILLLVSFGVFQLFFETNKSNDILFKDYYAVYTDIIELRSTDSSLISLTNAMQAFKSKEYKKAVLLFSNLAQSKPYYILTEFYSGLSYLELEHLNEAISALQNVCNSDNDFKQEAQWYLALAYLKNNQKDKVKSCLKEITNNKNHFHFDNAMNLLKELN